MDEPSTVVDAYNPSTGEAETGESETSLGYIVRPCLKTLKQETKQKA
jgi:hypothetical protein